MCMPVTTLGTFSSSKSSLPESHVHRSQTLRSKWQKTYQVKFDLVIVRALKENMLFWAPIHGCNNTKQALNCGPCTQHIDRLCINKQIYAFTTEKPYVSYPLYLIRVLRNSWSSAAIPVTVLLLRPEKHLCRFFLESDRDYNSR